MMERHTAVYNLTGKLKRVLLAKLTYYKIIPLSDIARDFYDNGTKPDQNRYSEWVIQSIKNEEVELSDAAPDHSIIKADKTHKTDSNKEEDETEDNLSETFYSDGYGRLKCTKSLQAYKYGHLMKKLRIPRLDVRGEGTL